MLVDHGKSINFSHRDLNDGNVMIKVNGPDDVDVWLIDFGKSMATVDKKEQVSAGMWSPPQNNERIFDYNPTTDTVRLITNITQSLIRSYAEKGVAPEGDVRIPLRVIKTSSKGRRIRGGGREPLRARARRASLPPPGVMGML